MKELEHNMGATGCAPSAFDPVEIELLEEDRMGWICPRCGCCLNPKVEICSCYLEDDE